MGAPNGKALFNPFVDDATWDLSSMSYREWLDFIFRHPPNEGDAGWYFKDEWEYKISDNRVVLGYLKELFLNSGGLADAYTEQQLESGFWFVLGTAGFIDALWDQNIELSARVEVVRAQAAIFRELFSKHPLDTSVFMWWDLLEGGYYLDNLAADPDDEAIRDAILWTLGEILGMDEWHCVGSALHGLNHLHHPRVPEFIDYFLATKQGLDEEVIAYALLCREGKAL